LKKVSETTLEASEIIEDSLDLGVKDGTIRKDINIEYTFHYLMTTSQIVLRDSIIPPFYSKKYKGKKYFYEYLDLFIKSIEINK